LGALWLGCVLAAGLAGYLQPLALGSDALSALSGLFWAAAAAAVLGLVYAVPYTLLLGLLLGRWASRGVWLILLLAGGVAGMALLVPVLDGRFDPRFFANTWWLGASSAFGGWVGLVLATRHKRPSTTDRD